MEEGREGNYFLLLSLNSAKYISFQGPDVLNAFLAFSNCSKSRSRPAIADFLKKKVKSQLIGKENERRYDQN